MSDPEPLIELLSWDTSFFGFQVARVCGETLSHERARRIDVQCSQYSVRCLYFLTGLNDPVTTSTAESLGYHYSDIRLTFEYNVQSRSEIVLQEGTAIRNATPGDLPVLQKISGDIYRDTRFFYDRRFPVELSAELYRTWIQVSLNDPSTRTLVANHDGQVAGFITCTHRVDSDIGQIGLVGVSPEFQGVGIGPMLVAAALDWFKTMQVKQVTVVTQGNNRAAQRLYQRLGFITQSVKLWYHKWYEGSPADE